MKILVVCGAGASSTFVAQRLRRAAHGAGLDCTAIAGTPSSLLIDLDDADLILVGPHLAHSLPAITRDAQARGGAAVLLPEDVFSDLDGSRTLALVQGALAAPDTTEGAMPMPHLTRTVRIGSSHGLHARPAKLFAQAAKDAGIPITIAKDAGAPANAASILGVIALGIEHGDYVTLTADGDGAEQALDTLAELLTTDHDS